MRKIIPVLRNGQITIPKEIRTETGICEGSMLIVETSEGRIVLQPVEARPRRPDWMKELYEAFEPVREALKDVPELEINRAIDAAIREVRSRK